MMISEPIMYYFETLSMVPSQEIQSVMLHREVKRGEVGATYLHTTVTPGLHCCADQATDAGH